MPKESASFAPGKCAAFFNIVSYKAQREVCADGAKHCKAGAKLNVTIETKVPALSQAAAKAEVCPGCGPDVTKAQCAEISGCCKCCGTPNPCKPTMTVTPLDDTPTAPVTDCTISKSPAHCCNMQYDPPSKCWATKGCRWSRYGCVLGPPPTASPTTPSPLCFHEEDTEDHKCFEACNAEGKKFATKGIENAGNCPASYNTVDTTKTVLQCPDGVTNVRYCAATSLNVTITTKGEAGVASRPAQVGKVCKVEGAGLAEWDSEPCEAGTVCTLEGYADALAETDGHVRWYCMKQSSGLLPVWTFTATLCLQTTVDYPAILAAVKATGAVVGASIPASAIRHSHATCADQGYQVAGSAIAGVSEWSQKNKTAAAAVADECSGRTGTFCVGPPYPFMPLNRTLLDCPSGKRAQCENGWYCENSGTGAPVDKSVCQTL